MKSLGRFALFSILGIHRLGLSCRSLPCLALPCLMVTHWVTKAVGSRDVFCVTVFRTLTEG
jgi:hypothetical protein